MIFERIDQREFKVDKCEDILELGLEVIDSDSRVGQWVYYGWNLGYLLTYNTHSIIFIKGKK